MWRGIQVRVGDQRQGGCGETWGRDLLFVWPAETSECDRVQILQALCLTRGESYSQTNRLCWRLNLNCVCFCQSVLPKQLCVRFRSDEPHEHGSRPRLGRRSFRAGVKCRQESEVNLQQVFWRPRDSDFDIWNKLGTTQTCTIFSSSFCVGEEMCRLTLCDRIAG